MTENMPSDECLSETERIALVSTEEDIAKILIASFASEKGVSFGPKWETACHRTAKRIMQVREGMWPLSFLKVDLYA